MDSVNNDNMIGDNSLNLIQMGDNHDWRDNVLRDDRSELEHILRDPFGGSPGIGTPWDIMPVVGGQTALGLGN